MTRGLKCIHQSTIWVTLNQLVSEKMSLNSLSLQLLNNLCVSFIAWLLGWFGFSFVWILFGFFVKFVNDQGSEKNREIRNTRITLAIDEKASMTPFLKSLPSWVHFPDTERVEWINKVMKQMWPFVVQYIQSVVNEVIEPRFVSCLPEYLKSFHFEKVNLGSQPFRLGSVKCYDEGTSRDEIILDLEIIYSGNCDIQMQIKGLKAGIRDLELQGTLRVELKPLLREIPIIGGISLYFLTNPFIDFNVNSLADVLDIPGINQVLREAVSEQLEANIVFPQKWTISLAEKVTNKYLKFTKPLGVLRLELKEGKDLRKADVGLLGMGKSDPYAIITIGEQVYKTHVIKNTVDPKWGFICEAAVYSLHGQSLGIQIMDEDYGSKDDFLGKASVDLGAIEKGKGREEWLKLEETDTGRILIKTKWLSLSSSTFELDRQLKSSEVILKEYRKHKSWDECVHFGSIAIIQIYLDSAQNLPLCSKKGAAEPCSKVIFSVERQKQESTIRLENKNPVFEEVFTFFVGNPKRGHTLKAKVMEIKGNEEIGAVVVNLKDLFEAKNMEMDQPFVIQGKGKDCRSALIMALRLRVLVEPETEADLRTKLSVDYKEMGNDSKGRKRVPSIQEMVFSTVQPFLQTDHVVHNNKQHSPSRPRK